MMSRHGEPVMLDVLVVDDDELVGRTVKRMAPADVSARCTTSKPRAIEFLHDLDWPCAVALIDVRLGRDRLGGLDVLEVALAERPNVKCVLVTGSNDIEMMRRAFDRRVHILPKPFTKQQLETIFEEARPRPTPPPSDPLVVSVARRALEWRLSPKQRDVLRVLVANEKRPHEATARALGMKLNTLRAHIRGILERSGLPNVDVLRDTLRRDSLSLREAGQVARRSPRGRGTGVQPSPRGRGTRAQIAKDRRIGSSRHSPRCLVHLACVSQRGECRVRILAAGLADG